MPPGKIIKADLLGGNPNLRWMADDALTTVSGKHLEHDFVGSSVLQFEYKNSNGGWTQTDHVIIEGDDHCLHIESTASGFVWTVQDKVNNECGGTTRRLEAASGVEDEIPPELKFQALAMKAVSGGLEHDCTELRLQAEV